MEKNGLKVYVATPSRILAQVNQRSSSQPHQNGDTAVSPRTLAEALDAAARAHAECAEADRRVAQLLPLTFPMHANGSSSGAVNESSGGAV